MWTRKVVTSITRHRAAIGCFVIWMLAASSGLAQTVMLTSTEVYPAVLIQTGLLTFIPGPGRSAEVTVTELGAPDARSTVRVAFYDETDRAILKDEGELQRGQPVHVKLPLAMPERSVRLRASILIVDKTDAKTLPVVVLESVDINSFAVEERVSCAPPEEKEDIWCPPIAIATHIAVRE
jgi:hypothetical protein